MTTGRINQVNGAVVETVHLVLRETDDPERPSVRSRVRRESRLSVPTVAGGAVPRTLGRRTRSVSRFDTLHTDRLAEARRVKNQGPPSPAVLALRRSTRVNRDRGRSRRLGPPRSRRRGLGKTPAHAARLVRTLRRVGACSVVPVRTRGQAVTTEAPASRDICDTRLRSIARVGQRPPWRTIGRRRSLPPRR